MATSNREEAHLSLSLPLSKGIADRPWFMSLSVKTKALTSAGLASTRASASYPRASPVASSSLPDRPFPTSAFRKGKAKAIKWIQREEGEEEEAGTGFGDGRREGSGLSSRDVRLSRAARFGSSRSSSLTFLPETWDRLANDYIQKNVHLPQVRSEYLRFCRDARSGLGKPHSQQMNNDKAGALPFHIAAVAPFRFAAIRAVLQQVRIRLGPDTEAESSGEGISQGWLPSRIVEYNCRASEGLWAAQEIFGTASTSGVNGGIASYVGYTSLSQLSKLGMSFIDAAAQIQEDGAETLSSEEVASHNQLNGIQISYKNHPHQPDAMHGSNLLPELKDGDNSALILSSYSLLLEHSDRHRQRYVRKLIEDNPKGEVLVFIEEATERGFAAIASAREYLLGSDEQSHQENESRHPARGDWHVVAPCPHDKPCPLLHDFELAEEPHVVPMRKSYASSPLFHGAKLDMNVCSFSARLSRPKYLQWASQDSRPDEAVLYSYLVVKKGPRPSIGRRVRQSTSIPDGQEQLEEMTALRKKAYKTKGGILDKLRAGTKHEVAPLGEEIHDEVDSGMSMNAVDDASAREELLKVLPEALKSQLLAGSVKQEEDSTGNEDEALQLTQQLMGKSAAFAREAKEKEEMEGEKEGDIDEETALAGDFLDQVRSLQQQETDGEEEQGTTLDPSDIEAMRLESTQWPRLIRSPIKRSGHVTLDVCSYTGSIDRFTVSKSMGKQVYQDARKASQGDIFPHVPFSDDENLIFEHKSQVTRVPAASSTRGSLPAMFHRVYRKPGKEVAEAFLTPSGAIGPDRVAFPTYKKSSSAEEDQQVQKQRERRGERAMKSRAMSDAVTTKDRNQIPFHSRGLREEKEMIDEIEYTGEAEGDGLRER